MIGNCNSMSGSTKNIFYREFLNGLIMFFFFNFLYMIRNSTHQQVRSIIQGHYNKTSQYQQLRRTTKTVQKKLLHARNYTGQPNCTKELHAPRKLPVVTQETGK